MSQQDALQDLDEMTYALNQALAAAESAKAAIAAGDHAALETAIARLDELDPINLKTVTLCRHLEEITPEPDAEGVRGDGQFDYERDQAAQEARQR